MVNNYLANSSICICQRVNYKCVTNHLRITDHALYVCIKKIINLFLNLIIINDFVHEKT